MSYHGANFPRRLTWEWAKNQFHYCLPLSSSSALIIKGYFYTRYSDIVWTDNNITRSHPYLRNTKSSTALVVTEFTDWLTEEHEEYELEKEVLEDGKLRRVV